MAATAHTTTAATSATSKFAQLWAVLLGVLAGILTALRRPAPARTVRPAVEASERPAPVAAQSPLAAFAGSGPRSERSLPPTIKQRIRAEAHGASPVSRQRTAGIGDTGLTPAADALADPLIPAADRHDRVPCAA